MTASPAVVPQPAHPLSALTTFELRNYRRELEHALTALPDRATVRELLRDRLTEVLGEQESRTMITDGRQA